VTDNAPHIPVLLEDAIAALDIAPGERHVDGTFGAGGYSRAMIVAGAEVFGFDRDPDAIAAGRALEGSHLRLFQGRFSQIDAMLADAEMLPVDGVVYDIGVSSMQLDQAARGFSFQSDGPLDMRMEQEGESAADFVNLASEGVLADVIYSLGDEPKSRRIARAIVAARPVTRTSELANIVRRATGYKPHDKKDPATRTFQAIRIHVNRELEELEQGLEAAERALRPGGRLAVVTFHSLEDRLVKRFLRARSGANPAASRHAPAASAGGPAPSFERVAKAVRPSAAELARNPRARSATLRVARRTAAPSWTPRKGERA
jgi:16S rRNA (cytosine1402-N4)-methyltransferase